MTRLALALVAMVVGCGEIEWAPWPGSPGASRANKMGWPRECCRVTGFGMECGEKYGCTQVCTEAVSSEGRCMVIREGGDTWVFILDGAPQ